MRSSRLPSSDAPAPRSRAISFRSFLLGTLGVCLVCGLTPYNDFIVSNTFLVGGYFPPVIVVTFFVLGVFVNATLHRFTPRHALSSGELSVVMGMMLVSCSIPSQGMMRFLIPTLVSPFHFGASDELFWRAFVGLGLPEWLFPVPDLREGPLSAIVVDFYNRVQPGEPIPYAAWVIPLAGWGVFYFALMATALGLALLLRRQWAENERLPFPIAQLQAALIEPPRRGRSLNEMLGSRVFWIGLLVVFAIHALSGLNRYFPRHAPEIPLRYDLRTVMANEPWVYFGTGVKTGVVYFTFVGLTYFIRSRVGFSLWSIFLITELITVQRRLAQDDITPAAWQDQMLGASVAFTVGALWIGRRHWPAVVRGALGRDRDPEAGAYRVGLCAVVIGLLVMVGWLLLVGVRPWVAVALVGFILMAHFVVARVVAQTGLPFIRAYAAFPQVYTNLPPAAVGGRDVFFSSVFTMAGVNATRESHLAFAMHALQVDEAAGGGSTGNEADRRRPRRVALLALLAWAMALGYVVAAASSLRCYYTYAAPLTDDVPPPVIENPHALEVLPRTDLVDPLKNHAAGRYPPKAHRPWLHMGVGAAVTGALQAASSRWSGWPFMPVGYLISSTWYAQQAWFSILLGWIAKVLIVRFGGASMFVRARPLFVGIIFGEALAAGIWLVVALVLASQGMEYEPIRVLPT